MAFLSKIGNMLRQRASKQISSEFCALKPSVYQAIRCLSSMSTSKLFIGGLSYATDEQSLKEAFAKYGEVVEARIIMDRETGRSRGFGFVTYTSSEEASSAIQALDGQDLHGRRVRVNYATDRARPSFGGGNYGGGYGGGGGGYGGGGGGYGNSAYGGGGGYGAGGSGYGSGGYGSGGNYQGGGGGGGNYGSDSYGGGAAGSGFGGSGVGYSGDGNYAGGNTYEGVNSGGYGSTAGNYGVAGGDGGSDNYVGAGNSTNIGGGGFDGGIGQGSDGVNQFGSNESSSMGDVAGDFNQDDPLEENQRDDGDETGDFAKRA
ncbi:glycine-rich RNA-binding protein 10 [Juglans microcarpa x Juglans regia]|uniref:glycine-rich RNA-binding protein 10 n=1 Tax=Juglans microcarpa x Juglans regia TaxID=2249226 RepID=UPI001B7EE1DF|nr:glycine-rich RNA-binding protein 10 [Juglans microcarpa x Juglans regia]